MRNMRLMRPPMPRVGPLESLEVEGRVGTRVGPVAPALDAWLGSPVRRCHHLGLGAGPSIPGVGSVGVLEPDTGPVCGPECGDTRAGRVTWATLPSPMCTTGTCWDVLDPRRHGVRTVSIRSSRARTVSHHGLLPLVPGLEPSPKDDIPTSSAPTRAAYVKADVRSRPRSVAPKLRYRVWQADEGLVGGGPRATCTSSQHRGVVMWCVVCGVGRVSKHRRAARTALTVCPSRAGWALTNSATIDRTRSSAHLTSSSLEVSRACRARAGGTGQFVGP